MFSDEETRKKLERQKRFGTVNVDDDIENEKKRKRLERFGLATNDQNVTLLNFVFYYLR